MQSAVTATREKVAWAAFAAGMVSLWWLGASLPLPIRIAGTGILLLGLIWLGREGLRTLFGPVLFYDLLRMSRKGRYFTMRSCYILILLLVLYPVYEDFQQHLMRLRYEYPYGNVPKNVQSGESARLGEWFFSAFMIVQFGIVFLLTPAYTAGAVSEEKERKTLEFLLATDLSNREIIFSKLASRLASMLLIVLTGLPVLSLVQLLGGVDPNMVVAGFAATGLTLLSVSSFSLLCSVYVRRVRDAIVLAYFVTAGYLGISSMLYVPPPGTTPLWAEGLNAGNIYYIVRQLRVALDQGDDLAVVLMDLLRGYALFHLAVALFCIILAVLLVRSRALSQMGEQRAKPRRAVGWRPPIRRLPMVWKEIFMEPGLQLSWAGWLVLTPIILVTIVPPVALLIGSVLSFLVGTRFDLGMDLHWIRISGTLVACVLLLGVALRAAGAITTERERETLDGLLTTPMQSHDILFAKWLGSLVSVRWGWLWVGMIWLVALLSGALYPPAFLLLFITWLVHAGTLAGIGLWFSTVSQTTQRATLTTLVVVILLFTLPGLLWLLCTPIGLGDIEVLATIFSPPVALYWLFCDPQEFLYHELRGIGVLFGAFCYAMLSVFLWTFTRNRFRRISARMPHRRPDSIELDPELAERFKRLRQTEVRGWG